MKATPTVAELLDSDIFFYSVCGAKHASEAVPDFMVQSQVTLSHLAGTRPAPTSLVGGLQVPMGALQDGEEERGHPLCRRYSLSRTIALLLLVIRTFVILLHLVYINFSAVFNSLLDSLFKNNFSYLILPLSVC